MKAYLFATAALLLSGTAAAQDANFNLTYTTNAGPVEGGAVTVTALLTATRDQQEGAGAYDVTDISGKRGAVTIGGLDPNAVFQTVYYPAQTTAFGAGPYTPATFFDGDGITFVAGTDTFQLYRDPTDTSFYHEFDETTGIGRLVNVANLSVTAAATGAVPEPASWALMIAGIAATGYALRRRRAGVALPVLA